HRKLVGGVAKALRSVFGEERVFYDRYHEVELSQYKLDVILQKFYRHEADLIVVFLCGDYSQSEWCGLEWDAIRDLMKSNVRNGEDVMLLRLDDQPVDGMLSIHGFID